MVTLRQLYTVFGHDERWRKFATACTQPMVAVYLRKLGDTDITLLTEFDIELQEAMCQQPEERKVKARSCMHHLLNWAKEQGKKVITIAAPGVAKTEEKPKEEKRGGRRRARSKGGPTVMSIDSRRTVETDADKAKNDLIDLTESLKADKILTGKVQGVEKNFQGHNSVAVLYHGVFKIVIPAEDMVDKPEETDGRSLDEAYHYMLTRRLGAETDYLVNSIFYDDMIAFASRLDAMQVKRKRFYRGGEGALVHEGVRAEARVVSVIRAGIFVDLFGVECFIPLRELSYQRIANAMSQFKSGDRVIVKVLSVDNKDMNNIKIKASVKQASVNPYEFALKKYSVGNRYVGTVSMVDKNGVFVSLEGGVDCLCRFPARGRPMKGARVTVQILGIDEKSNRIWGIITHASMTL